MSPAFLTFVGVIFCILFRLLNVNYQPIKPYIACFDESFLDCIYKYAPILRDPYVPTLWGYSGHLQTVFHSIVGRVKCPWPSGDRIYLTLDDNSTLTYDLYQPLNEPDEDVTVAICPGIGNSSETVYIRSFVHLAQSVGYRCAVLNHIGALPSVEVTSSRIFSYGHTDDYSTMVEHLEKKYPSTYIVAVGFSLGGNIVTKYMGEHEGKLPRNVIGGISICQGYNAVEGTQHLMNWENFRRLYLYFMTENVKQIIRKHKHILLSDDVKKKHGINESDISYALTLPDLDEVYTRKIHNFPTVHELYQFSSSLNWLSCIKKPMVFINSKDDPLIPEVLLEPIKEHASKHPNTLYVEVAHGGHLGFYEGGYIYPNAATWLDRATIAIIGGIVLANKNRLMHKVEID